MREVLSRLQRTKMALASVLFVASGTVLLVVGQQIDQAGRSTWITVLPWNEFGAILVGAGVLSIWLDHFFHREHTEMDELRLRRLLHDHAPVMRDAVLDAFAANHEDLARVATPETLDDIITNSLALRLQDHRFASEIYRDIRDQAVAAAERWHNAILSIDLTPWDGPATGPAPESPLPAYFAVTVRWEYTTVPRHAQRRFICLSDRQEYVELANQRGDTSAWYIKPGSGLDVSSPDAFELLRFSVNGDPRPIRRASRKNGQIYTVAIGREQLEAEEEVRISYTYRTVTTQAGHLLFFDLEQPTRDVRIDFDYAGCDIASVSVLDLVPSVRPTRIERTPVQLPSGTVRVDVEGWVFPRSGIAFIWTLETETSALRPHGRRKLERRMRSSA